MGKSEDKIYTKDNDKLGQLYLKLIEEITFTEITPAVCYSFDEAFRLDENYENKLYDMVNELFTTVLNISEPITTLFLSLEHNQRDFVEKC